MKNKIIYLFVLTFSVSIISSANQNSQWPGIFNYVKAEKKQSTKEKNSKEDKNPDEEYIITPALSPF